MFRSREEYNDPTEWKIRKLNQRILELVQEREAWKAKARELDELYEKTADELDKSRKEVEKYRAKIRVYAPIEELQDSLSTED